MAIIGAIITHYRRKQQIAYENSIGDISHLTTIGNDSLKLYYDESKHTITIAAFGTSAHSSEIIEDIDMDDHFLSASQCYVIDRNRFKLLSVKTSFSKITLKSIKNLQEEGWVVENRFIDDFKVKDIGDSLYLYSKSIKQVTEEFNAKFPVGFRCLNRTYGWYEDDGTQYWLIGLVAVIIFFICAILFESLYQALVIILLIPVSMVGVFLTYHFSGTEFGTGGFASMVLLCGLTVNAGIYLMNEYNHNGKRFIKAYNHKIISILLTVVSTIVGLIPFLIDGAKERFWFSFSIGSISGLVFSLVTLVLVMPMLMKKK